MIFLMNIMIFIQGGSLKFNQIGKKLTENTYLIEILTFNKSTFSFSCILFNAIIFITARSRGC